MHRIDVPRSCLGEDMSYYQDWKNCFRVLTKNGLWKDDYYDLSLEQLRENIRKDLGFEINGPLRQLHFLDVLDASLEE